MIIIIIIDEKTGSQLYWSFKIFFLSIEAKKTHAFI